MSTPDFEFVAYIDESGDPGLKRVRPIDERGSTEWMTLSAVLVRREKDPETTQWVADINRAIGNTNTQIIHFKDLDGEQKLQVCNRLSDLPVRLFVVASNKKNMRRHRNERAEKVNSKQWFYNWMVRILLERVTDWCFRYATHHRLHRRHVKFVFSQSGGHSYSQTAAYHELLKYQSRGGRTFLTKRTPRWEVMSFKLVEDFPHYQKAGLQFADVVASAFYQAVDNLDTGPCNVRYAMALEKRMALGISDEHHDYSVVLQPTPCWEADISEDQKSIFRHYGYDFTKPKRW
ncbi:DUF3800 domain-containing protein [Rhizobium sp. ARZ01]|uniref:DUF3800 domain-containing protein n=1 Tax=Rhizobium sp. ARZ01 TaxID=2769313 RepID=UPI001780F471|nr:DUF3800 domain-containing protein [Rhizobium sp. ARZ01]MBD9372799.1 DUF3800 domain-containing protein [Rhizobium sp. ARZ01]